MIAMKIIAAIACFLMAMMAAGDAQKARERGRWIVFLMFLVFAVLFAGAFAWVLLI